MITALLIGAGLLYGIKRAQSVSGIGMAKRKAKRRIYSEIEAAQKAGIDLTDKTGWEKQEKKLAKIMKAHNIVLHGKSDKPDAQRYFNSLRRAYNAISGTNLPYKTSRVYNENGDVILEYHDYNLQNILQDAVNWVEAETLPALITDGERLGYFATICAIASGTKFVWASKGVHRGVEALVFGSSVPAERKLRISYLASPDKGGVYPEAFAHYVWENYTQTNGDDLEITNGVLAALREIQSVGQAQKYCVDMYVEAHKIDDIAPEDLPF